MIYELQYLIRIIFEKTEVYKDLYMNDNAMQINIWNSKKTCYLWR